MKSKVTAPEWGTGQSARFERSNLNGVRVTLGLVLRCSVDGADGVIRDLKTRDDCEVVYVMPKIGKIFLVDEENFLSADDLKRILSWYEWRTHDEAGDILTQVKIQKLLEARK